MPFEDKENLSDLKTFGNAVYFNDDVHFYGKILGDLTFSEPVTLENSGIVQQLFEKVVVKETDVLSGTLDINIYEGSLIKFNTNASGNFAFNFEGNINVSMPNKKSLTITILCPMGSTAYVINSSDQVKIDGVSYTVKWIGSSSPSSGFTNSINAYTFVLIKNAESDFTILGSLSRFG
jgi:hypothetical protein